MVALQPGLDSQKSRPSTGASPQREYLCNSVEAALDAIQGQRSHTGMLPDYRQGKAAALSSQSMADEEPERIGGFNELWDVTRQLEKRLELVEVRTAEAYQRADPRNLDDMVARVHAELEAQCAALYREQSEALTKQMSDLLTEVQHLTWKALEEGSMTHRSDGSNSTEATNPNSAREPMQSMDGLDSSAEAGQPQVSCRLPSTATTGTPRKNSDSKEIAFQRLEERVRFLETCQSRPAFASTSQYGVADLWALSEALKPAAAEAAQGLLQEMREKLETFAVRIGELTECRESMRAANEPPGSGKRQTLPAARLRPEASPPAGPRPCMQEPGPSQLHHCSSAMLTPNLNFSPAPATRRLPHQQLHTSPGRVVFRTRTISPPTAVGSPTRELRGRCTSAGHTLLAHASPGHTRSPSPLFHELNTAQARRSAHASPCLQQRSPGPQQRSPGPQQRLPSATPMGVSVATTVPNTPQVARRQASSPSPMPFAVRPAGCQRLASAACLRP